VSLALAAEAFAIAFGKRSRLKRAASVQLCFTDARLSSLQEFLAEKYGIE
jgi:hypothetical protein